MTLEQELETANKVEEDILAVLKALYLSASNTDSRVSSLNEQIKRDTPTYMEEIERLKQQLHELRSTSEGPDNEFEKELESVNNSVKSALVEEEEATRQLQEMQSEMNRFQLKRDKAINEAIRNEALVKKLTADWEARTADLNNLQVLYNEAVSQRAKCCARIWVSLSSK
ncbi:hypothetical protein PsorP6_013379 [Peronosclerospora sorghi]|uniref:Uncharacterized protein n=1 Tax=Peronosclerospora sorghi TaxID=230839 RepID=A0ACC0WGD5_9STRA|nr:hypothetical protein PsorP6_013379 [Peronosclerospora sorghi]